MNSARLASDPSTLPVPRHWVLLAAALPAFSFGFQYLFAVLDGTLPILQCHPTILYVDWIFVPFNLMAVGCIDWRRGGRLFGLASVSLLLNAIVHALWQGNGGDPGHMISPAGVLQRAGWVHVVFATLQGALLTFFVFVRADNENRMVARGAVLCMALYFVAEGLAGRIIHGAVIVTDAGLFGVGVVLVIYRWHLPKVAASERAEPNHQMR